MKIDMDRITLIARTLHDTFADNHPAYDKSRIPELKTPVGIKPGSIEHSYYLFYGVLLDFRRDSEVVWKSASRLATEKDICNLDRYGVSGIEEIMGSVFDNGIGNPAKIIYLASKKLRQEYGDPRNLFSDIQDYDTLYKRLIGFYHIGTAKVGMFAKNFIRSGFLALDDPFDYPPKVDIHLKRMSIGMGAVRCLDSVVHHDKMIKGLSDGYRKACRENRLDPAYICDAKWLLGSGVCQDNTYEACYNLCPLDCGIKPKTDRSGSYLMTDKDARDPQLPLFRNV